MSQLRSELEARGQRHRAGRNTSPSRFIPAEHLLVENVDPNLKTVELAVDGIVERLHDGDREGAAQIAAQRALPSIARSDAGLVRNLELNRREAAGAAMRITASTRTQGSCPTRGVPSAVASAYFGVRVLVRYLEWSAERSAELEQFAGRVAHDIRSPLGPCRSPSSVMETSKDIDSKTRGLLERVGRTMQHVRELIDDLLVFATAVATSFRGSGVNGEPSFVTS